MAQRRQSPSLIPCRLVALHQVMGFLMLCPLIGSFPEEPAQYVVYKSASSSLLTLV
jgi:hypothetical protein